MKTIISVSTAIYDGYDMDTALEGMARAGVTYVEPAFIRGYMGEFTESDFARSKAISFRNKLDQLGLLTIAMSSHIDLGANDAVDIFKGRMDFAKILGSQFIISNTSKFQFQSKFYKNIKILAEYAEDIDLIIAIENPGHGKDDLFGCGLDAIKIIQKLESEFVKINYDVGNVYTYNHGEVEIISDLMAVIPMVAHLHLKDMDDFDNGWQFCGIGKGLIDWKSVINLIIEQAPQLPLALEIPLRLRRPNYSDPTRISELIPLSVIEEELKASLNFVNGLLKVG